MLRAAQVNNLGNAPMPEHYATVQSWMWDETERVATCAVIFWKLETAIRVTRLRLRLRLKLRVGINGVGSV